MSGKLADIFERKSFVRSRADFSQRPEYPESYPVISPPPLPVSISFCARGHRSMKTIDLRTAVESV